MPDSGAAVPAREPVLRERIAAGLFLAAAAFATIGILARQDDLVRLALVPMAAFLLAELRFMPAAQRAFAGALIAIGVALMAARGEMLDGMLAAGRGGLDFLLLFAGVTFMQYPALHSPAMRQLSESVSGQSPARRYLALSVSAHVLGGLTNFAALSLLATTLTRPMPAETQRRMAAAIVRGFSVAANWSPFFVSIAVILTVMPDLRWSDFALAGAGMAAMQLAVGFFWDRLGYRRQIDPQQLRLAGGGDALLRLVPLVLVLGAVPLIAEFGHVPMSLTILLTVPLISIGWQALIVHGSSGGAGALSGMGRHVVGGLAGLRSEVLLFFAANMLGQGAARYLNDEMVASLLQGTGLTGWVAIAVLLTLMTIAAAVAVHPVVMVVLVGHVLPPATIDILPSSMALMLGAVWALGVGISPLSGLSLYFSRVTGQPLIKSSLVAHAAYTTIALIVCIVYICAHDYIMRTVVLPPP